jgi:hypothetical protein
MMKLSRVLCCVGFSFLAHLSAATGAEPAPPNENAALVEKVRLLEARLRQVEEASAVLEVGAVELTIPAGETSAAVKVTFRRPPAGKVVILTGETGTAGSWVVTKSERIAERDFEVTAVDAQKKAREKAYTARIGYVVLRADSSLSPSFGAAGALPAANTTSSDLSWAQYRLACGQKAQEENEAQSEAVFRQKYHGRDVTWSG